MDRALRQSRGLKRTWPTRLMSGNMEMSSKNEQQNEISKSSIMRSPLMGEIIMHSASSRFSTPLEFGG